jgi:hypothetical protein
MGIGVALAFGLLAVSLSTCSGGIGDGSSANATLPPNAVLAAEAHPAATAVPKLPPQGIYDQKCEPRYTLKQCKASDLQAAQAGIKLKVAFIGLSASAAQLQELLTYDASIGITQYIAVGSADEDGLYGTNLIATSQGDGGNWPASCKNGTGPNGGAVTNEEFIKCIYDALKDYKAFGGWYLYDEPGCPNTAKGYCWASLKPAQDANIPLIAAYIHSIDSRPVIGANGGGGYSAACSGACLDTQMTDTFGWLSNPTTPYTGGDYYPIGCPTGNNCNQQISDLDFDIPAIVKATHNAFGDGQGKLQSEKLEWVEQAFSWAEEASCPAAKCPFPTARQMQKMRDVTLWDSAAAGNPVWSIWWYAQPDANCQIKPMPGCDPHARWSALTQAINAPYPAQRPSD